MKKTRVKITSAKTVKLAVDSLDPNDYNPNQMTESEFDELVTEVKRLNRIAKPVIVRPKGERFSIVDGEHNWRAAKEAGIKIIPCEVTDIDDFEAMQQTFKRNQHGNHNPVRLGQMFQAMMQKENLSQRALAARIDVSEGTVRNALIYAKAAALRNDYAFEGLTVKQVRNYLEIPAPINDCWLDASDGDSALIIKAMAQCRVSSNGKKVQIEPSPEYLEQIVLHGFAGAVSGDSKTAFTESLVRAFQYWNWTSEWHYMTEDVTPYAIAAATEQASVEVMELLPFVSDPERDDERLRIPVTVEEWAAMVALAVEKGDDDKETQSILRAALRLKLHEKGIVNVDFTDPRMVEAQQVVNDAPDFIRDADLTWSEKHQLAGATCTDPNFPPEKFLEAKRQTVETLLLRNELLSDPETCGTPELKEMLSFTAHEKLNDVLYRMEQDEKIEQENQRRDAVLLDRATLHNAVMTELKKLHVVREGTIGERPTHEIVAERFHALPWPEFQLVAGLLTGESMSVTYWLESIRQLSGPAENELTIAQQERLEHCTAVIKEALSGEPEAAAA